MRTKIAAVAALLLVASFAWIISMHGWKTALALYLLLLANNLEQRNRK